MKRLNVKGKPLQIYIFASMVAFVGITITLLWLFQVVFMPDFYASIKRSKVDGIVSSIEEIVHEADGTDFTSGSAENAIYGIATRNDVTAILTDASGNIFFETNTLQHLVYSRFFQSETFVATFSDALDNVGKAQYLTIGNSLLVRDSQREERTGKDLLEPSLEGNPNGGQSIIVVKVAENAVDETVAIVVIMEITPVNTTVETLKAQFLIVTALLLGIASFIAILISRQIAKPIRRITEAAKHLGKETYSYEVGRGGIKEVRDLNDTLRYVDGELGKIERLRKEFIANISHDLRTPLTMIKGYSEVIRDLPGENTKENIQVVIDEAERLQTLVNDILELSKIEEHTLQLKIESFDLRESISEIVERYRKMLESKGYDFLTDIGEEPVVVNGDEKKLSQVIYNLLNNAVTYTGEDRRVRIRLLKKEGSVRVEVQDSGSGIPVDKLQDIWERYYKVESNHQRAQVGSGLGLSIVRSIIDMHEGNVGVESSSNGSTFWFELPTDVKSE